MPTGNWVFVGVVAVFVIAAVPTWRGRGRMRYFLSANINEIPQVFAAAVILTTALSWWSGDLRGTVGVITALVAGAVVLGTGELLRRCLRDERQARDDLRRNGLAVAASSRIVTMLTPIPIKPRVVRRRRGIAYGEHRRQRLDVHRRRGLGTPIGVIVYLHGGGYYSGGRYRESRAMLHRFAKKGWICVSAGYRLRPRYGFEHHLADARAALAWAHANVAQPATPRVAHPATARVAQPATPRVAQPAIPVVMAGSSAGAHLSTMCALTQDERTPASRVDAVVGLYGYYGRYYGRGPDEDPVSDPMSIAPRGAPPFFLAHGARDSWVAVEAARELRDHLRSGGATVTYVELAGAQHGFDQFDSLRYRAVIDGIESFLSELRPHVSRPRAGAPRRT